MCNDSTFMIELSCEADRPPFQNTPGQASLERRMMSGMTAVAESNEVGKLVGASH